VQHERNIYGGTQWSMISMFETLFKMYPGFVLIKLWSHILSLNNFLMVCSYVKTMFLQATQSPLRVCKT